MIEIVIIEKKKEATNSLLLHWWPKLHPKKHGIDLCHKVYDTKKEWFNSWIVMKIKKRQLP
jgi:hypothetical protein